MFCLSESDTFYLYPYPTDMRKSFYSLSGIVTNEMKRDVQDGEAFIFVNRSLTSMKILHAEYGGLVIYNLKLEKGCISLPDMRLDDDNSPPAPPDPMAGTGTDGTGNQSSRGEAKPSLAATKAKEGKVGLNTANQLFVSYIFCTFAL